MPIQKLTVFVAWPSDVERERNVVFKIVGEINGTIGQRFSVTVEARDWTSVVGPGAGRPQAVINKAIGTYDIFIGILWKRLGTPSGRAASGFAEELGLALNAWRNRKKGGVSVLVYIREDSPRSLDAIDTKQLDAVRAYKAGLFKRRTLLARAYKGVPAFEKLLRQHLTNEVLARLQHAPTTASPSPARAGKAPPPGKKPAPVRKRAPSKPRLDVPTVRRLLTDADRKTFARKALTACLREFRATAKAFNAGHAHAEIVVKQDGPDAFTATADANGQRHVTARVELHPPDYGRRWMLAYQTARPDIYGGGLRYSQETTVATDDDLYTPLYRAVYGRFPNAGYETESPLDVARLFWDHFKQRFDGT